MKRFSYTITVSEGLHARPARRLAETVRAMSSTVTIEKGDANADAGRLMSLMLLGAGRGDTVTVTVTGECEDREAPALEAYFRDNL